MNKQQDAIQKTTYNTINVNTIAMLFNRSKSYRLIRMQYQVNYNCITVLLGCYLYSITVNQCFRKYHVFKFVGYYSNQLFSRYIDKLVVSNLLNLSGKYYSITQAGYKAIEEISNTNDKVLYEFCNKYNIVL
jgi:predicted transcriptional regulator